MMPPQHPNFSAPPDRDTRAATPPDQDTRASSRERTSGSAARPPATAHYHAAYFAGQVRKSEEKLVWQYGRIFAMARVVPQGNVLDVGCGAGPGLRYLKSQGVWGVGVDLVHYPLCQARRLLPNAEVVQADVVQGLPFASQQFDVVLMSELIEHLPSGPPVLRECYRVLRPGGAIVVTTPNQWDMRRVVASLSGQVWSGHADPTHINLYTPLRLAHELRMAGFVGVRWRSGVKPMGWLSSRRLRLRLAIPFPPLIGNGLVAVGWRDYVPSQRLNSMV